MGDLAEALACPHSRITRQIKRLHEQGLALRDVSPHDRRRVVVTITGTGRTVAQHAMITYANVVRTHFLGPLNRPQITTMAATYSQISAALKRSARSGESGL